MSLFLDAVRRGDGPAAIRFLNQDRTVFLEKDYPLCRNVWDLFNVRGMVGLEQLLKVLLILGDAPDVFREGLSAEHKSLVDACDWRVQSAAYLARRHACITSYCPLPSVLLPCVSGFAELTREDMWEVREEMWAVQEVCAEQEATWASHGRASREAARLRVEAYKRGVKQAMKDVEEEEEDDEDTDEDMDVQQQHGDLHSRRDLAAVLASQPSATVLAAALMGAFRDNPPEHDEAPLAQFAIGAAAAFNTPEEWVTALGISKVPEVLTMFDDEEIYTAEDCADLCAASLDDMGIRKLGVRNKLLAGSLALRAHLGWGNVHHYFDCLSN
jgi:hypothetical protein